MGVCVTVGECACVFPVLVDVPVCRQCWWMCLCVASAGGCGSVCASAGGCACVSPVLVDVAVLLRAGATTQY